MNERKHMNLIAFAVAIVLLCSSYAFAGLVPDTGDPDEPVCNPKSYTDLGNGVIQDDVTGLMWQQATAPGTYTWEEAVAYTDTLTLGSYSDWRLPTMKELSFLINTSQDISQADPAINTSYFPGTISNYYWSSIPNANLAVNAWVMDFGYGEASNVNKGNPYYVRAVRGAVSTNNDFVDNNDGTITDRSTGLMWQKATAPGTYTWQEAVDYSDNLTLGSYADWRLPTRNELHSIVDYSSYNPSINTAFFPDTQSLYYRASTAYWSSDVGVVLAFNTGVLQGWVKRNNEYVRAVRAGQCGQLATTTTTTVSGSTTTTTTPGSTTTTTTPGSTTTTTTPISTTTTTKPKLCPAEAIYGEDSEETELLRKYRDNVLSKTPDGQEFIKNYYKLSPSVTKLLEQRPLLKNRGKALIDSMLPEIKKKVDEIDKEQ